MSNVIDKSTSSGIKLTLLFFRAERCNTFSKWRTNQTQKGELKLSNVSCKFKRYSVTISNMLTVGATSGVGIGTGIANLSKHVRLSVDFLSFFLGQYVWSCSNDCFWLPIWYQHFFLFYYNFTLMTHLLDHSKYNRILDHSMCIHLSF